MTDKILVSNNSALTNKYGASGLQSVQAAIARLVAADLSRGLQTIYTAVDDPAAVGGANGSAATDPNDSQQNENAVNAPYDFRLNSEEATGMRQ